MRKCICMSLVLIMSLAVFCGCGQTGPNTDSSDMPENSIPSVEISYDEVSYIIPGENTSSVAEISQSDNSSELSESGTDETSEVSSDNSEDSYSNDNNQSSETSLPLEQQTGGLLVKMVKYDYDNTFEQENAYEVTYVGSKGKVSIALLDITNETDKHYSITINGKYLDKDGKVLKTETQTWDQFKSGWQKYFLFRPGFVFDKFEYTIETSEYKGDCWKCDFSLKFTKLKLQKGMLKPGTFVSGIGGTHVEGLRACAIEGCETPFPISHGMIYFVLFDRNGGIVGIYQCGETNSYGPFKPEEADICSVFYSDSEKMSEWPDALKGEITGVFIISSVDRERNY